MRKTLWLPLAAATLALVACQNEETPPPPDDNPTLEGTVVKILSNAWDAYYSPDGASLVFVEAYRLATYNLTTHQKNVITPDFGSLEFAPRAPVWLTDDNVAYIRKDPVTDSYEIWTVPSAGGTIAEFYVDADEESSLVGDAAGRYVTYTHDGSHLLYRLDLQTGATSKVTKERPSGYGHFDAVIKPNTGYLYFLGKTIPFNQEPHAEYIYQVQSTGAGVPWIIYNTDKPFLAELTISPDDKYLVFAHRDGLFSLEYRTGQFTWLTRAPDTWAEKDRYPCYAPDGQYLVFTRKNGLYRCDAP